jgi:pSer/pThr/pTyr-binding forkhead associated (FHA) protein
MSTAAPPRRQDQAETATPDAGITAAIAAGQPQQITDSLPLLDHRTRSRTIPLRLAPRGAYLALRNGDETRLLPLSAKVTHIGRSVSAQVRFEDQRVSRSHAIIVRHGRFARLLDNRSANGTYLNDRRIVATNIRNGDLITVASLVMQYVEVS